MKITFYCGSCGARLSADDSLVGREITCPYCHKTTRITREAPTEKPKRPSNAHAEIPLDADGDITLTRSFLQPSDDDFEYEDMTQTESATETTETTIAAADSGKANDRSDFALEGAVYQNAQAAETENAVKNLVPEFHANPFGVSFPLERLLSAPYESGSEQEDEEMSGEEDGDDGFGGYDNLPDVDELIRGVE